MSEFLIYFEIGLHHVLDIKAYDHTLFLVALTVPYAFKDWRRILLLLTVFTAGHTMSLILSVFKVVLIRASWVELLIPLTILIVAGYNLLRAGKANKKDNLNLLIFITLCFGIIHGLGFSNYFDALLSGDAADKLLPLLEFALGIELGQAVIVLMVLLVWFIMNHFGRFSKRDFALVVSAFVIGVVTPMVFAHDIWN